MEHILLVNAHILSVGKCLSIFVNTLCMFITCLLNVLICVKDLVFPSIYSIYYRIYKCLFWILVSGDTTKKLPLHQPT